MFYNDTPIHNPIRYEFVGRPELFVSFQRWYNVFVSAPICFSDVSDDLFPLSFGLNFFFCVVVVVTFFVSACVF